MDIIEQQLKEIKDKLYSVWRDNRCLSCPIAELAALSAATYQFYVERQRPPVVNSSHESPHPR